jgi:ADP-heptose:LPS heptosyltransferase
MKKPRKLILCCGLCPGDIMTLTVAVHSLHVIYPGQYLTDVRTPCPDIWQHNPHITPIADDDPDAMRIEMEYPQIHRSNQTPINFLACYTEYLGEKLGRPLYACSNRPLLYLSEEEQNWMTMLQEHWTHGRKTPFGVLVAGTKCDYTIKQWPVEYYQEVIDRTLGLFQWVQIGEAGTNHNHPRLDRCISLLGETTHRMLHRLVYHASVGLGPVTYLMHLCSAFEKPYVYLAGGREPVTFLSYPKMHTLHTIGALPCCQSNACWKSRVIPIGDGDPKDRQLCEYPVIGPAIPVARCMAMIQPDDVVRILQRYAGQAV